MGEAAAKRDLKSEMRHLYRASATKVAEVEVPRMSFLMIDGAGDPNTSADYRAALEALFSVAYAAKFIVKRGELGIDYGVMPLEGLWWAEDMAAFTSGADRSAWLWTMMIMQPEFVSEDVVDRATRQVTVKKGLETVARLRFEPFAEGRCAQVLHVGPFSQEGSTIAGLHAFIAERGRLRGKHHEIYLSDIRKAAPDRWRTIIRQPFE